MDEDRGAPPDAPADGASRDMAAYYRRRAPAYDRIYRRPERQAELRAIEAALPDFFAGRSVLEIACGTGWWTPHGAQRARRWLATDVDAGLLDAARARPVPPTVEWRVADAFALESLAGETFDAAFAGFWWSHVPRAALAPWLASLHARLAPGACVMMLDNRYVEGVSTPVARVDAAGDGWQTRRLDDGSLHEVRKNFPTADEAIAALGPAARAPAWHQSRHYWWLTYTLA